MPALTRSNRALLAGLGLSLVIHAGTLLALGRTSLVSFTRALPEPNPIESPAVTDDLRLGIADSDAVTVNWIGVADPTEHLAPESLTDQPALAIDPGESVASGASSADPRPEAAVPDAPAPMDLQPREIAAVEPAESVEPAETPLTPADLEAVLDTIRPVLSQLLTAAFDLASGMQRAPAGPAAAQPSAGDPGEASDKDSTPTAIAGSINVVPGRPAAAKGLTIKTVRPRWRNATLITSSPDNPTVIIHFLRDGTVHEADFAPGKTTGYPAVDGPLLDAVYAWRAEGVALSRLPAADPTATLEVRINVILR
jgi:hypothetical protein